MQYDKVYRPYVPRSFQDLSYEKQFNCDMGQEIPVYIEEALAGDRWSISNETVIRFQPLVAPVMQNISVHFEYFFVPFRIMFEDWEEFLTGGVDGQASESISLPLWNDYKTDAPPKYSLWDYFGLPLHATISDDNAPLSFARTAYNMIWNEYYRDETIDDEIELDNNNILRRRWRKDYFTSALPFQQRGVAPAFSIYGGQAPVTGSMLSGSADFPLRSSAVKNGGGSSSSNFDLMLGQNFKGFGSYYNGSLNDSAVDYQANNSAIGVFGSSKHFDLYTNVSGLTGNVTGTADLSGVSLFDISELRLANQIQLFLELNARSGYKYDDFLLAHFGIAPKSAVLDKPEFLGSFSTPLQVSEVLQTSESTDNSPQGNLAGRGLGLSKMRIDRFTCPEPGLIIGLMCIVPSTYYNSQGVGKMWTRRSRYDFYFPEFAHLTEQPILKREVNLINDDSVNKKVFGYQGIYDEYRHRRSEVVADMRDIFDYWNISRKFPVDEEISLNSSFIEMNPRKDIFAVKNEPGFICDVYNIAKAVRPIPSFATPGGLRF